VWIWIDLSPSMDYKDVAPVQKDERAIVLALALASLLSNAGERVGIPGIMEPKARRNTAAVMIQALGRSLASLRSLPDANSPLSRHSELVIFSDFLRPLDSIAQAFGAIARQGVRGHMLRIADPAEEVFPFHGRIEFLDMESGERFLAERAETERPHYLKALAAYKEAFASQAMALGWTSLLHHTDRPAVEALLPLHMLLSGLEKGYRGKGAFKAQPAAGDIPA